jgi:hypothetical protein
MPKLGRDLVPWAPIYFRVYAEVYLAQRQQTQGVETHTDCESRHKYRSSCVSMRKRYTISFALRLQSEREREKAQATHERRYASADTSLRVRGFAAGQQARDGEPLSA